MCFSSNISFIAAGALTGIGLATIRAARASGLKPIAYIPLLFAAQQAAEGIIWLTHDTASLVLSFAKYLFFCTALIFWPTYLPFSIYYAERDTQRKKSLFFFVLFGILFSVYALYIVCTYPLHVTIINHSIAYILAAPVSFQQLQLTTYVIPTIIPLFISSLHYAKLLGTLLIISLAISYYFFYAAYGSVWCFFAALVSGILLYVIKKEN